MALIRYATREITAKLVYYGPGLSGKTSNLQYIHSKRAFGKVGELLSLATGADRTLFFDLLPVSGGTIAGFTLRFQLFTVPGQIFYNKTRKMVLRDADGVVLVADSAVDARERNRESLDNLKQNLHENGLDYDTIPLVLQLNKRDLADPQDAAAMDAELNERRVPRFEAVATNGTGVIDTLQTLMRQVLADLDRKYNLYRTKSGEQDDPIKSFELGLEDDAPPLGGLQPARPALTPPGKSESRSEAPTRPLPPRSIQTPREPPRPAAPDRTAPGAPDPAGAANGEPVLAELLARTVARLEALATELRNVNDVQVRDKRELLDAIDGLRAPGLMSLDETARYLRVAPGTLETLASQGAIPCTRLEESGAWLFAKPLVDEWVARRSRGSG